MWSRSTADRFPEFARSGSGELPESGGKIERILPAGHLRNLLDGKSAFLSEQLFRLFHAQPDEMLMRSFAIDRAEFCVEFAFGESALPHERFCAEIFFEIVAHEFCQSDDFRFRRRRRDRISEQLKHFVSENAVFGRSMLFAVPETIKYFFEFPPVKITDIFAAVQSGVFEVGIEEFSAHLKGVFDAESGGSGHDFAAFAGMKEEGVAGLEQKAASLLPYGEGAGADVFDSEVRTFFLYVMVTVVDASAEESGNEERLAAVRIPQVDFPDFLLRSRVKQAAAAAVLKHVDVRMIENGWIVKNLHKVLFRMYCSFFK